MLLRGALNRVKIRRRGTPSVTGLSTWDLSLYHSETKLFLHLYWVLAIDSVNYLY